MFGDRFSSSTSCSGWLHETAPGRPDQSLSCRFLKIATHPSAMMMAPFLTIGAHPKKRDPEAYSPLSLSPLCGAEHAPLLSGAHGRIKAMARKRSGLVPRFPLVKSSLI